MLDKHKTVDNVVIIVIADIVVHHYQLSLVSFYMESQSSCLIDVMLWFLKQQFTANLAALL